MMPEVNVSRREFQEAARAAGALSKKEQKNRDFWQLRKDRKKATQSLLRWPPILFFPRRCLVVPSIMVQPKPQIFGLDIFQSLSL